MSQLYGLYGVVKLKARYSTHLKSSEHMIWHNHQTLFQRREGVLMWYLNFWELTSDIARCNVTYSRSRESFWRGQMCHLFCFVETETSDHWAWGKCKWRHHLQLHVCVCSCANTECDSTELLQIFVIGVFVFLILQFWWIIRIIHVMGACPSYHLLCWHLLVHP